MPTVWLKQWDFQPLSHSYLHRMLPNFDIYLTTSQLDILDRRGSLLQLYVLSMLAMPVSQQ